MDKKPSPRRHPAENGRAIALGLAVGGFGAIAMVVGVGQADASNGATNATSKASVTSPAISPSTSRSRSRSTTPTTAQPATPSRHRSQTTTGGS